jgi:hypothetical protein
VGALGSSSEVICNDVRQLVTKNLVKNHTGAAKTRGENNTPSSDISSTERSRKT